MELSYSRVLCLTFSDLEVGFCNLRARLWLRLPKSTFNKRMINYIAEDRYWFGWIHVLSVFMSFVSIFTTTLMYNEARPRTGGELISDVDQVYRCAWICQKRFFDLFFQGFRYSLFSKVQQPTPLWNTPPSEKRSIAVYLRHDWIKVLRFPLLKHSNLNFRLSTCFGNYVDFHKLINVLYL